MKPKFLMAGTIFGNRHIDLFFRHCLPSLMSKNNFPLLNDKTDLRILIHTDKQGQECFRDIGLPTICDVIGSFDKYQLIGLHEHQDLKCAKELGANFHLLMPDFVYSENCFKGVLAAVDKGHKAIARLVVSTVQEDMAAELNRPRSAEDLATLSLKHMHPGVQHWKASKDGYYPNTHVLAWQTKDRLRMCSPHMTPVYIASEVMKIDDTIFPLDSILDRVIEGDIYCPQPEDGIGIIEVSPREGRKLDEARVDLTEFCRIFKWDTANSRKQFQLFQQETVDAVKGSGDWNDVEISEQKAIVYKAIEEKM